MMIGTAAAGQRRFAFYDTVGQNDPFFDCVRSSDIYGIVCVLEKQLGLIMSQVCVRTTPPHDVAAMTGEVLFNGIIAINAVLRNDIIPVRVPDSLHSDQKADTHTSFSGESPPAQVIFEPHRATDPMDLHPLTLRKLARTVIDLSSRCGWHSIGAEHRTHCSSGLPQLVPRWDCPERQRELIDAWAKQHVSDNDGDDVPSANSRRQAAIAFTDLATAMHDFNGLVNLLASEMQSHEVHEHTHAGEQSSPASAAKDDEEASTKKHQKTDKKAAQAGQ